MSKTDWQAEMKIKRFKTKIVLFSILAFVIIPGCSTVQTSAKVDISSTTIAYYIKHGQGPTIVFQSGLGDGKEVWKKVIERMPGTVSIFAYDRPGYGDSSHTGNRRDPCAISHELHELLKSAGVAPPYILVGHSLGGLYQFSYSKLYPNDVAGLVLLDPTHPDHWMRIKNEAPAQAALLKGLSSVAFHGAMRQEFDEQEGCLADMNFDTHLTFPTSLLFSGQFRIEEKGSFEKVVRELREGWLLFFNNAESSEIAGSGHYIQEKAPERVVMAINDVIDAGKVSKDFESR